MQVTFDLKDDLSQQLKKIPDINAFVNQVIKKALQGQKKTKKSPDLYEADDIWVQVEKYLHGKIVDMGGKTKANIHLELEDGTSPIKGVRAIKGVRIKGVRPEWHLLKL